MDLKYIMSESAKLYQDLKAVKDKREQVIKNAIKNPPILAMVYSE